MAQSRIENDLHVAGTLTCRTLQAPSGAITNAMIAAAAGISASKLERHQSIDVELYAEGAITNSLASRLLHIVRGSTGTIVGFEAMIHTVASATTQTLTLDLQKATTASTFISVLTTPLVMTNAAARTATAATVNTSSLADGDVLRCVVTAAGSTTNHFQGLNATLTITETYS